ncbi:hypothetical protein [Paenibacillus sp. FSL K6-1558]|uniref:hypothetical protein n=1 Tax=Paenibacillus sp. FSL K6-1558 TaxID=2921473 RepID=UPI0030FCCEA2
MNQTTLEGAQAKIDSLAKDHFSESDYELFCAVMLQLEKYKSLSDTQRSELYNQDKEFANHMEIQQEEINSLTRSVSYWQHQCTLLYVENKRLKREPGEGAEHGGGDYPNGAIPKSG